MDLRKYQSADPLADITDEDLRAHTPEVLPYPTLDHAENPAEHFRYDDYVWDGFSVEGQVTLKLTKGYFTFITPEDIEKIGKRSVCAHEDSCPHTGRLFKVRAILWNEAVGKPQYLHRFLMDARKRDLTDHVNRLPLDNRSNKNLWNTDKSFNASNRFYKTKFSRGVKQDGLRFRGQIWFEGKGYFSRTLDTEKEASEWYKNKYAEFYGDTPPTEKPELSYPVFPLRKPDAKKISPLSV